MEKITYLFGAGASCGVLPTICNFPERLNNRSKNLSQLLTSLPDGKNFRTIPDDRGWYGRLEELFKKIAQISNEHSSIDTYAKKLFIKKEFQKLNEFKVALSAYFIVEMILNKGKCDRRYDNFWASIIKSFAFELPKNMRIVTWNYDAQLEQSFLDYEDGLSLANVGNVLNIFDGSINTSFDQNSFAIYKMNGTASFANNIKERRSHHLFDDFREGNSSKNLSSLIDFLSSSYLTSDTAGSLQTTLTYAWETTENINNRKSFLNQVAEDIAGTTVLVVIGYSFPFFNREIDRLLLQNSNIRKVFVQDHKAEDVITSMQSVFDETAYLNTIDFVQVPVNDNQFFIPFEL